MLGDTLGLTGDGAHQDDAATLLEGLVGLTSDEELTTGVDVEHAVEFLGGDILEVAERHNAGVGGDDVELAEVSLGLLEQLNGLLDVGNVGLDGNGVAAHSLDLGYDLVGLVVAVGVVDDNVGATAGELESHLLANTTACKSLRSAQILGSGEFF